MEVDHPEITERQSAHALDNGAVVVKKARTDLVERDRRRRNAEAQRDYGRGSKRVDFKGIKNKKLRGNLKSLENRFKDATIKAKDAEILLENTAGFIEPESELERTYKVRQDEIQESSSLETAQKRFELKLAQGPYVFEWSRTGRELLLGGRKGHVATMDWRSGKLGCELQLNETVRDVQWLHNNQLFAVSQKERVYIYDRNGVEIHCLKQLREVSHIEYLPYHFLLATASLSGFLKWFDVSTGQIVTETPTKLGPPVSLTQNKYNAILHVGQQNGTVTLWSPNSTEPLVKLLAHKGPVLSVACDREGRYMVSAGNDRKMSIWDLRMYKEVNNYYTRTPASSLSISDQNLTAVGWGTSVTVWKDLFLKNRADQEKVQSPYLNWGQEGKAIERVRWCPFEDLLGAGHDEGFSSVLVPGAGLANFDALEITPFETVRQRQESEVKGLLNKLQPGMIALNPNFIGDLDLRSEKQRQAEKDLDAKPVDIEAEIRNRARGKNSALRKYLRKQKSKNIIDEKRLKVEELWKEQQQQNSQKRQEKAAELGPALGRFARRE
ncbi:BING4CT domain-containing protein [Xylariales sp. AK1849]|nr:BING4CT domain-containing protein [Xylariales sp. AK1849]